MGTSDGNVLGTTKIVDNGPNGSRFNIVLMGDGYQASQMAKFAQDAQRFVDALFAAAPFDSLRALINVHRVDVTSLDSGADDPARWLRCSSLTYLRVCALLAPCHRAAVTSSVRRRISDSGH